MGNGKNLFLYPLAVLYRLVTDIRNLLFDTGIFHSEGFSIPVICIGNITVGGTGKTPHTEYLIDIMRNEFKVAVMSRGYKRKSAGFRIADLASKVREIGDEPLQIFRKFPEILVAVDRDRRNGIKRIMEEHPEIDVIILDDAFQHRSVKPGLSILLTDYNRLITRDHLMPYGNLRENRNNSKRADLIVISKTPGEIREAERRIIIKELKPHQDQKLFFTTISHGDLIPLFEKPDIKRARLPEINPENHGVVLITGIAVPGALRIFLDKYFKEIHHLKFTDHHYFGKNDIDKVKTALNDLTAGEKIVITTEKDAVRLREFPGIEDSMKRILYYIPVKVDFLKNDKQDFDNLILEYVRKNRRNHRVP
jgi:tetraacyldisaccharide 4'-kinase